VPVSAVEPYTYTARAASRPVPPLTDSARGRQAR
jgi:hypothetical protein